MKKARVTAICAVEGRGWYIHASPIPNQLTYKIKIYNSEQNCITTTKNSNATHILDCKEIRE
ncbi:hypothetical protein Lalb_Chr11g0070301 [Lupinus albus]|uniref:Uncharacterized protein n=1 Tax=Lupinus albus TaxID=3870 RepID=A0A6A4PRQ7_LUPAL|nr:hypothetical protein Lalb_Chr11g0070301 [Lupinus albus]